MTNEEAIFELGYAKDFQTPKRKEAIDMAIEALKQTQWIPCEERLPDMEKLVLTTIKGTDIIALEGGETLEDAMKRAKKMVRVSVGFLGSDGWYGADGFPEIVTPCAWMPLPKPYEGRTE